MPVSATVQQINHERVIGLATDTSRVEVWPTRGFNCATWQIRKADGSWGDILFSMPDWIENPVPTRSGHPILFPFPNRLARGRMTFQGRSYQLPLTESTRAHAIHGFTPRVPWRVLGTGTTGDTAFVIGQFRMSDHVEHSRDLWPGDLTLTVTYLLSEMNFDVRAELENRGDEIAPYGLGYHAYFRHPLAPHEEGIDRCRYRSRASLIWECDANIPTGSLSPIPDNLDFRIERPLATTVFDTLLTGMSTAAGLNDVGSLAHPDFPGRVVVMADETFPHLVVFTPPHRRAIAIEPYTCATNAANLDETRPHGWRSLAPGLKMKHDVSYRWVATP
jgi:aldose 1-epimerase